MRKFKKTKFIPIAIKIDAPRTAHILAILDPTIRELNYDKDLHQHYIVFDFPKNGDYVIMKPKKFHKKFGYCRGVQFMSPFLTHPV